MLRPPRSNKEGRDQCGSQLAREERCRVSFKIGGEMKNGGFRLLGDRWREKTRGPWYKPSLRNRLANPKVFPQGEESAN